jgi:methionyl-tRNA formyltransferase
MNEIKALLLCNGPIAVPGIKEFLFHGKAAAIATPKRNGEMQHVLQQLLKDTGVPLLLLTKQDYKTELAAAIKKYEINLGLMMTFPYVIPPEILALPEKGFINFHYGLLPQVGGAQPVLWHLLRNDLEAGITIHKVDEGVDTGPIIIQEKIPIEVNDTYGLLESKLAFLAAKQAANLLKILSYGTIIPSVAQDKEKVGYYKMATAKDLTINWARMTAAEIVRLVNACNPWNKGAGASINGWMIGITEVEIMGENTSSETAPGTILACSLKDGFLVKTADNEEIRINIVFTNEGFFSGGRMSNLGLKAGMRFT